MALVSCCIIFFFFCLEMTEASALRNVAIPVVLLASGTFSYFQKDTNKYTLGLSYQEHSSLRRESFH